MEFLAVSTNLFIYAWSHTRCPDLCESGLDSPYGHVLYGLQGMSDEWRLAPAIATVPRTTWLASGGCGQPAILRGNHGHLGDAGYRCQCQHHIVPKYRILPRSKLNTYSVVTWQMNWTHFYYTPICGHIHTCKKYKNKHAHKYINKRIHWQWRLLVVVMKLYWYFPKASYSEQYTGDI